MLADRRVPIGLSRNVIVIAVPQQGSLDIDIGYWPPISNAGVTQLINGDLRFLSYRPKEFVRIGFSRRAKNVTHEVHVGVLLLRPKGVISVNVSLLPAAREVAKVGVMAGRSVDPIRVDLVE